MLVRAVVVRSLLAVIVASVAPQGLAADWAAPRIRGYRKNVHYFLTPWDYLDVVAGSR